MAVDSRRLNVVRIRGHLGGPGPRMHGVRRWLPWIDRRRADKLHMRGRERGLALGSGFRDSGAQGHRMQSPESFILCTGG